jgi:hypothetical protein
MLLRRLLFAASAAIAGLLLASPGVALTCDWTGAVTVAWSDPANWTNCGGGVPGLADTAVVTGVPFNQPVVLAPASIGGLSLGAGSLLTVDLTGSLTLDGNASGAGNIRILGTLIWVSGTMSGTGTMTVEPQGSLSLFDMGSKVLSRNLVNNGTTTATGGNSSLIITNGVTFTNSGLYEIHNGSDITGQGTFLNLMQFRIPSGGTVSITVANWTSSGSVEALSGTLSMGSASGTHGGNYNFTGNRLTFPSGTHTVTALMAGSIIEMNTSVAFLDEASIVGFFAAMEVRGPVSFDTGGTIHPLSLILQAGAAISGADDLATLNCTWDAGTLAGTGTFTITTGGTLLLAGPGLRFLARETFNHGDATADLAPGTLAIPSNRTFHNEADGSFRIHNAFQMNGEGTFDNAGILEITTTPGPVLMDLDVHNSGLVDLGEGTVIFHEYAQAAGTTTLDGGLLEIVHQELFLEGGTLEGSGEIGANVFVSQDAVLAPGASPGALTIHGSYVQSAPASYSVEIAGTSPGQFDQIEVDFLAALGGSLDVTLQSFAPSAGDSFPVFLYDEHFGRFASIDLPPPPPGLSWLPRYESKAFSLRLQSMLPTVPLRVDERPSGGVSNVNGVLEDGERVIVEPAWVNPTAGPIAATGTGSNFAGPPHATYTIVDAAADYGTVAAGNGTSSCFDATANCYELHVASTLRAGHWDATMDETLSNGDVSTWTFHLGGSFSDVLPTDPFYRFVETIFHNLITAGCGGGEYCGMAPVTRAQMAVFLLVSRIGLYTPPPETGAVFADVPSGSFAAAFIEDLAARGVTAGCGGGNYCPNDAVTREQMAVFLLRTLEGPTYVPPDCTEPSTFADVPCASPFARWIEDLVVRGVTAGCGGGLYCPAAPVSRGQMAVFLTTTFGLTLNGA